jgi:hypothetical protein
LHLPNPAGPDQRKTQEYSKPSLVSILYQNTLHRTCEIVLESYTNFTQWQKAVSARKKKNLKMKEFKVNKLFSSDANSLTPEHTVMIKTCYDL